MNYTVNSTARVLTTPPPQKKKEKQEKRKPANKNKLLKKIIPCKCNRSMLNMDYQQFK